MGNEKPIQIDIEAVIKAKAPKAAKKIPGFVYRFLEKTICQERMNYILRKYAGDEGVDFARDLLNELNVSIKLEGEENIPADGKFTFVSNHPLGGLDGIALVAAVGEKYHSNIRFLVNDLLMNVKPLAPVFIPINKHGGQAKDSAEVVAEAYRSDNQILFFPAGLVSRLQHDKVRDLDWKKAFVAKTVQFQRDVIPVYFDGQLSMFFYRLAQFRKRLGIKFNIEMVYLPSELFKCENKTFTIRFGKPIPWQTFDKTKSQAEWASEVKRRVYQMNNKLRD